MTGLTLVSMSTRVASGDGPASAAPEQAEERRIRGTCTTTPAYRNARNLRNHPRLGLFS